jgi:uncharacterized protein (DUF2141 family)
MKKWRRKMKKVLLTGLFLMAVLAVMTVNVQSEEMGTLTINMTGFQNDNGFAMVSLHNSEVNFSGKEKAFRDAKIPIKDKKATCEFKNIPKGTYSVRAYHDVNANGQLDKNMVGFPKEPYGISNNAKSKMSTPKFEKAKFDFNANMTIEIKVD